MIICIAGVHYFIDSKDNRMYRFNSYWQVSHGYIYDPNWIGGWEDWIRYMD